MSKIALITGANKGIGFAVAQFLGKDSFTVLVGARQGVLGKEAEVALREGGADARFVELDVTDGASVAAAAAWIEAEYGRLDVLVNNAGIARGLVNPSETTAAELREVYETNVIGAVTVTNAMLPLLRRSWAGRIVNVSSELGSIAFLSDPEQPYTQVKSLPYPASKAALNMVTTLYAKELRDTTVKVNAANPGWCATDLNRHTGKRPAEAGAEVIVHLATLPEDGPSGVLYGHLALTDTYGVLPW